MKINLLMNMSNKKVVHEGEIIIKEGDAMGNEMYIILSGEVMVYKNYNTPDEVQLAMLSSGDFFGEMTLFLNKDRSATIIAKGTVVLLEINRMNAYQFFEKQPEATYSLIRTLCFRIEEANNANVSRLTGKPVSVNIPVTFDRAPAPAAAVPPVKNVPAAKKPAKDSDLSSDIYPEGHKKYNFTIDPAPLNAVVTRSYTCPVCDNKFKAQAMRTANLKMEKMDKDFRVHYNVNADPIHYDIVTCPACYYSTFGPNFNSPVLSAFHKNASRIKVYKDKVKMSFEEDREINTIFTGFYLALKSAPLFYIRHETTTAKVWLRLMWLYQDCKDEQMEIYAARQAHEAYMNVFTQADLSADAVQQLNITLGELCVKLGDLTSAKKFYFAAKTSKLGKPVMAKQADERLEEIREMEKDPS